MNYTQIAYAVAVADTLNFTEAAKINGISQPTLTFRITKLEEEFGYKLFNRTTKKVELTEAGKVFVDGAKKVVRRTEELEKIAVEQKKILSNTINIGLNNNYYHLGLTDYIAEYKAKSYNDKISEISVGLGLNPDKLRYLINLHPTESKINEFNRYDELFCDLDLDKARAYLEKKLGKTSEYHCNIENKKYLCE